MIMCILVWIHVHISVAMPTVVSEWTMAGMLRRLLLDYYYYITIECIHIVRARDSYLISYRLNSPLYVVVASIQFMFFFPDIIKERYVGNKKKHYP